MCEIDSSQISGGHQLLNPSVEPPRKHRKKKPRKKRNKIDQNGRVVGGRGEVPRVARRRYRFRLQYRWAVDGLIVNPTPTSTPTSTQPQPPHSIRISIGNHW